MIERGEMKNTTNKNNCDKNKSIMNVKRGACYKETSKAGDSK